MPPSSNLMGVAWWTAFTIVGIWVQKFIPGVDLFAPGMILSMQEQGGHRTFGLAFVWILLQEGMGNLPFGYGVAWYGMLAVFYMMGRWLFEARSILFMCLLGLGLGVLHPVLSYSLAQLAKLTVSFEMTVLEGVIQAVSFPLIWLLVDTMFPRRLRQDVRPL